MMPMLFAVIGAGALWLTFVWLAAAIVASQFSRLKGYGEKTGLVTGTMLSVLGAFVWAVWPAREVSRWNVHEGLGTTAKAVLAGIEVVILVVGVFLLITIDASGVGKVGIALVVVMAMVIAAALVKSMAILQTTGGKTMAELRAERETAGASPS